MRKIAIEAVKARITYCIRIESIAIKKKVSNSSSLRAVGLHYQKFQSGAQTPLYTPLVEGLLNGYY